MIKQSIFHENTTILKVYLLNNKKEKMIIMQRETDEPTTLLEPFILFYQKWKKYILYSKDTIQLGNTIK